MSRSKSFDKIITIQNNDEDQLSFIEQDITSYYQAKKQE